MDKGLMRQTGVMVCVLVAPRVQCPLKADSRWPHNAPLYN